MHNIDVVIATYNSEKRIAKTLKSFKAMHDYTKNFPIAWEFHIIDNNSNDKTQQVIEDNKGDMPIMVSHCAIQGKSAALNSVLPNLTGDLIVFTDDDVTLARDWLEKYWTCAQQNPDFDIFTGNIIGHWEKEIDPQLKSWIPLGSTFALQERESSGPCNPGDVWGPNMAIRKKVFDTNNHKFNEDIGPSPESLYAMGQETNMTKRLFRAGHKCYYNHLAVVHHLIKKETINDDWVIKRAERLGYGLLANGSEGYGERRFGGISLKTEISLFLAFWFLFYPITFIIPRSKYSFWSKWKYFYYRGLLKGYKRFL